MSALYFSVNFPRKTRFFLKLRNESPVVLCGLQGCTPSSQSLLSLGPWRLQWFWMTSGHSTHGMPASCLCSECWHVQNYTASELEHTGQPYCAMEKEQPTKPTSNENEEWSAHAEGFRKEVNSFPFLFWCSTAHACLAHYPHSVLTLSSYWPVLNYFLITFNWRVLTMVCYFFSISI
jgi:hypothetical protein